MGYYRAGFNEIVGIDTQPQPRYPFTFVQADALEYLAAHGHEFDAIHASPPCQGYSLTKNIHKYQPSKKQHPKLIEPVRKLLEATGKPYVIENVIGAPLLEPLMLCGTMFGLRVQRHRIFETNPPIYFTSYSCNHWGKTCSNSARKRNRRVQQSFELAPFLTVAGHDYKTSEGRIAMGIDWMTRDELSQAIPPTYTEWIGHRILAVIN